MAIQANKIIYPLISGGGNIVFFAGSSKGVCGRFGGDNGVFFVGDNVRMDGCAIDIAQCSLCYIDDNTTIGANVNFNAAEGKHIVIGRDCMFSWHIEIWNFDGHLIYDSITNKRIAKGGSIFIGDHVWFGRNAGGFKRFFIASGSIIGVKSMLVGGKTFYSNTANGGYPCKTLRDNIFWLRDGTWNWSENKRQNYESLANVSDTIQQHIFTFEPDKFLSPELIESTLNSFDNPLDKLRFLYNYLYCNTNKNRFALFKDSNYRDSKLYCENPNAFDALNFSAPQLMQYGK